MVTEIADLYGWTYRAAYQRLQAAFNRGRVNRVQRAGHQPYYLLHQVTAVFGPPPLPGEPSPKPSYVGEPQAA